MSPSRTASAVSTKFLPLLLLAASATPARANCVPDMSFLAPLVFLAVGAAVVGTLVTWLVVHLLGNLVLWMVRSSSCEKQERAALASDCQISSSGKVACDSGSQEVPGQQGPRPKHGRVGAFLLASVFTSFLAGIWVAMGPLGVLIGVGFFDCTYRALRGKPALA